MSNTITRDDKVALTLRRKARRVKGGEFIEDFGGRYTLYHEDQYQFIATGKMGKIKTVVAKERFMSRLENSDKIKIFMDVDGHYSITTVGWFLSDWDIDVEEENVH